MRSSHDTTLFEAISLIEPAEVIPVLERGIELEKIDHILGLNSEESDRRIRASRVLLALLYSNKLGVEKQKTL